MQRVLRLILIFLAGGWGADAAQAHFLWIKCWPMPPGEARAELYFSEQPSPGESHLISKVSHTNVWSRGTNRESNLCLSPGGGEEAPRLEASCGAESPVCLEAMCDYGVYNAHGPSVLLQYYAKHLAPGWATKPQAAKGRHLACDIVPSLSGNRLSLDVLYRGEPSANAQVVLVDPNGAETGLTADAAGHVSCDVTKSGCYAVRAAHLEPTRSGTRDGKEYSQTWHYATLTFDVVRTQSSAVGLSAGEVLTRARDDRAIWHNFPGFTADLVVSVDGAQVSGPVTIGADGSVDHKLAKGPIADWVEEQLRSMLQHRMPDGEVNTGKVTFAGDDQTHPLGRKIDLGDPDLESAYRIKDDVIMEVNRKMGDMRFTITVLEIVRNPQGKYLPRAFTMNFFDAASGQLRTTLGYRNDWQHVDGFDLPRLIVESGTQNGRMTTKEIVFANVKLLAK